MSVNYLGEKEKKHKPPTRKKPQPQNPAELSSKTQPKPESQPM